MSEHLWDLELTRNVPIDAISIPANIGSHRTGETEILSRQGHGVMALRTEFTKEEKRLLPFLEMTQLTRCFPAILVQPPPHPTDPEITLGAAALVPFLATAAYFALKSWCAVRSGSILVRV